MIDEVWTDKITHAPHRVHWDDRKEEAIIFFSGRPRVMKRPEIEEHFMPPTKHDFGKHNIPQEPAK